MRRLLAVVALSGLALAGAGCGRSTAAPAAASPSHSASPSPTVNPYAANTHEVCTAINQLIVEGAAKFGTDTGAMVGHLAGANQVEADKSRAAALSGLKDLAGRIRAAGQPAADPNLSKAVATVADTLERLSTDPSLLADVKVPTDVPAANQKVTAAANALTGVCV